MNKIKCMYPLLRVCCWSTFGWFHCGTVPADNSDILLDMIVKVDLPLHRVVIYSTSVSNVKETLFLISKYMRISSYLVIDSYLNCCGVKRNTLVINLAKYVRNCRGSAFINIPWMLDTNVYLEILVKHVLHIHLDQFTNCVFITLAFGFCCIF